MPKTLSDAEQQIDELARWITTNQPGEPSGDYSATECAIAVMRKQNRRIDQLEQALRLTVEYVGTDTLRPEPGWEWHDALKECDWFNQWKTLVESRAKELAA